jgi:acyl-CoA synthetase (AMP-forming)/AMP-acid ligase II
LAYRSPTESIVDIGAEARLPFPEEARASTVPELLALAVAEAGDRTAVIAPGASGEEEAELTYAGLEESAARVAGGFAASGLGRGERIGFLLSNHSSIEAQIAMHAAYRIGAIVVAINVRSTPGDVAWCLEETGCSAVLYEASEAEKVAEATAGRSLLMVPVGPIDRGKTDGETGWSWLVEQDPVEAITLDGDDPACWVFTSGTTGYPKTVSHTHRNCVASGLQIAEAWDLHPGDVYLNGHPFFTASGTITSPMAALWSQSTHVIEAGFSVEGTLGRVERLKATNVFWMTPALALLFASDQLEKADLSSVRRVLYGGQAMPREFHLQVNDVLEQGRGIELVHMIGQSEAGPSGLMLDPEFHRERLGAVGNRGYSLKHTRYALLDSEGREVGPGEEGELCFRTPSIMQGYVGKPDATREAIHGGWLHTGDLCRYDEDRFVYFVDRMKDVIRRGGINIASAEIENVMRRCEDVADVAAIPAPHEVLGETVKVVIVRREGSALDEEKVREFAVANLADYKVPKYVEFIDELPRNDMGKVTKNKLRG